MVEQVVIATAVMGLLLIAATCAVTVSVVRGVRRRYRSVRARLVAPYGARPSAPTLTRAAGSAAASSIGSPGWWLLQSRRHRMWRAVTSAEQAVAVAERADATVGELPALTVQLRAAATAVDAVLRASGAQASLSSQDRLDCDRIVATAADLRDAALASLRSGSHTETVSVVSAVQVEVAALAAGVRAARR